MNWINRRERKRQIKVIEFDRIWCNKIYSKLNDCSRLGGECEYGATKHTHTPAFKWNIKLQTASCSLQEIDVFWFRFVFPIALKSISVQTIDKSQCFLYFLAQAHSVGINICWNLSNTAAHFVCLWHIYTQQKTIHTPTMDKTWQPAQETMDCKYTRWQGLDKEKI